VTSARVRAEHALYRSAASGSGVSGPIDLEGEWQLCGLNHASPREWQTWAIFSPVSARRLNGEFAPRS
jgi:hypothetical protein